MVVHNLDECETPAQQASGALILVTSWAVMAGSRRSL